MQYKINKSALVMEPESDLDIFNLGKIGMMDSGMATRWEREAGMYRLQSVTVDLKELLDLIIYGGKK